MFWNYNSAKLPTTPLPLNGTIQCQQNVVAEPRYLIQTPAVYMSATFLIWAESSLGGERWKSGNLVKKRIRMDVETSHDTFHFTQRRHHSKDARGCRSTCFHTHKLSLTDTKCPSPILRIMFTSRKIKCVVRHLCFNPYSIPQSKFPNTYQSDL